MSLLPLMDEISHIITAHGLKLFGKQVVNIVVTTALHWLADGTDWLLVVKTFRLIWSSSCATGNYPIYTSKQGREVASTTICTFGLLFRCNKDHWPSCAWKQWPPVLQSFKFQTGGYISVMSLGFEDFVFWPWFLQHDFLKSAAEVWRRKVELPKSIHRRNIMYFCVLLGAWAFPEEHLLTG